MALELAALAVEPADDCELSCVKDCEKDAEDSDDGPDVSASGVGVKPGVPGAVGAWAWAWACDCKGVEGPPAGGGGGGGGGAVTVLLLRAAPSSGDGDEPPVSTLEPAPSLLAVVITLPLPLLVEWANEAETPRVGEPNRLDAVWLPLEPAPAPVLEPVTKLALDDTGTKDEDDDDDDDEDGGT